MLTQIDLKNPDKAISIIEKTIANKTFEMSQKKIKLARNKCLNQYNLFALISDFIEKKEKDKKQKSIASKIKITSIPCSGFVLFELAKKSIKKKPVNTEILKQYYSMVCRPTGLKGKLSFIKDFGLKNYLKIKTW